MQLGRNERYSRKLKVMTIFERHFGYGGEGKHLILQQPRGTGSPL